MCSVRARLSRVRPETIARPIAIDKRRRDEPGKASETYINGSHAARRAKFSRAIQHLQTFPLPALPGPRIKRRLAGFRRGNDPRRVTSGRRVPEISRSLAADILYHRRKILPFSRPRPYGLRGRSQTRRRLVTNDDRDGRGSASFWLSAN